MNIILGAGISGLSCSYHLGHENCLVLEKKHTPFGHMSSYSQDDFIWDQGPHVSFTKDEYVRKLFADSVEQEFKEFEVKVGNYFKGHWIEHPAQTSFFQIPEPLRTRCLDSFLESRNKFDINSVSNYQLWLEAALGPEFTNTFSGPYTRKYWTRNPYELTTDWIGERVLYPKIEDVIAGSKGPLPKSTHYINKVRYPKKHGYQSFGNKLLEGCNIQYGSEVVCIDLTAKQLWLANGKKHTFKNLINTLPLPVFINLCKDVPNKILEASRALNCTQLLLVNVTTPHRAKREENWIYIYDEDKYSTRINFTEKFSENNGPKDWSGIQSEVYFSRYKPLDKPPMEIGKIVEAELIQMGLIDDYKLSTHKLRKTHIHYSPWANIVFDHQTKPALKEIFSWLETFGLARSSDDLSPLTNWKNKRAEGAPALPTLSLAGRFGQWKYYWSDDCLLRGAEIAGKL